jgi:hypothetical protein
MVFLIQMLVKQIGIDFLFNNFISLNLDINVIVGYQILLQYLLRNLDEQPNDSFFDDVDGVNKDFIK